MGLDVRQMCGAFGCVYGCMIVPENPVYYSCEGGHASLSPFVPSSMGFNRSKIRLRMKISHGSYYTLIQQYPVHASGSCVLCWVLVLGALLGEEITVGQTDRQAGTECAISAALQRTTDEPYYCNWCKLGFVGLFVGFGEKRVHIDIRWLSYQGFLHRC